MPYPDLDRILDFENIRYSGADDGERWGKAFLPSEGATLTGIEVEREHFVLANNNADMRELV